MRAGRESVVHTSTPMADPLTEGGPVVGGIVDVASGTVAYTVEGGQERWGIAVGQRPDPDGTVLAEPDSARGVLSPDARLLAVEQYDTMAVYATADGEDITPTVEGYAYVVAYGWTRHDTASVLALRDYTDTRASGDVLSCDERRRLHGGLVVRRRPGDQPGAGRRRPGDLTDPDPGWRRALEGVEWVHDARTPLTWRRTSDWRPRPHRLHDGPRLHGMSEFYGTRDEDEALALSSRCSTSRPAPSRHRRHLRPFT